MSTTVWIILAGALLTFLTRVGGHVVLSRFERIHPRVEAGLNAVPAAVLTTLVAPAAMNGGVAETAALVTGIAVSLVTGGMMPMFLSSAAVLICSATCLVRCPNRTRSIERGGHFLQPAKRFSIEQGRERVAHLRVICIEPGALLR